MTTPEFAPVAEYLFALKPPPGGTFGIDRMRVLAAELGHPERDVPSVHVAGTNGKGSVSAMLESILRAAGWTVGLTTSPHLVHLGERVQVNRVPLTEPAILGYVAELRPMAERIAARTPELRPSFFEWVTAMAMLEFARRRCDIAVYEVGLGGRLDATNVLTPEVSVITSIGLDHCELLGTTLEQIAAEKAGIIKPGVPVVLGRMPPAAERVIRAIAAECAAPVRSVGERVGEDGTALPVTNLEGEYQRWNAATAQLAAETLRPSWRIGPQVLAQGLQHVAWAGRWQRVRAEGREVILDASHNAEGAEALDRNLADLIAPSGRRPVVVVGVLGAVRAGPLLEVVARHARELHLVVPNDPRACSHAELAALVPSSFSGPVWHDRVAGLFPGAGQCRVGAPGDIVLVTGSIYLLGQVLPLLEPRAGDPAESAPERAP